MHQVSQLHTPSKLRYLGYLRYLSYLVDTSIPLTRPPVSLLPIYCRACRPQDGLDSTSLIDTVSERISLQYRRLVDLLLTWSDETHVGAMPILSTLPLTCASNYQVISHRPDLAITVAFQE